MSRDPLLPEDPEPPLPDEQDPGYRLGTTPPGALLTAVLVGLVLGWALRPVAVQVDLTPPRVTWLQASVFYLVAAIVGWVAWVTRRAVVRRHPLRPHEAVNRLVLAKSCALAGALVAGGYLGYALSWVGIEAELADERIARSLVAALGAALTVTGSLLLERACRVSGDGTDN